MFSQFTIHNPQKPSQVRKDRYDRKGVLEDINRKLPAPQDQKANPYDKLREKGLLYRLDFIAEYLLCVQRKDGYCWQSATMRFNRL
jgi:hypothetical protein